MRAMCLIGAVVAMVAAPAMGVDEEHARKAEGMIAKAIGYLRSQQDAKTGGWSVPAGEGPAFPAITALVVNGMVMEPGIGAEDPAVAGGVRFLLSMKQRDGGIYDRVLPSYNTSIAVSALSKVNTPEARAAVADGVAFLRTLQWGEVAAADMPGETGRVGEEHPFYGGVGYGRHGRPDLSNLSMWVQAMHDAGVEENDAALRRAVVFLERVQMLDSVNDMPYADGVSHGGFVYATSVNKDEVGVGQSQAGTVEETLDDGTRVSRLRAYGSMTYAGFKSYVYADLDRDDERVRAAYGWIRRNYTLEENPGLGASGMYYYYVTFARALDAWGRGLEEPDRIDVIGEDGTSTTRDWANDLIDRLAELQNKDGSFRSVDDRWMENDPVLITAYALIALQHAGR